MVKVLLNVDADATRRRFERERRAMGRLSQAPGIAPLYGSGFTPAGQPYLLMPFYERGSLQQLIESHGPLPPEQVQHIGVRMCRAVQSAHEHGVLHRDLKPANILITRSGEPDVADFGIAHLIDDSFGKSQALTMTPLYTAPEVFDGVETGSASDVYSLGATLYAMLNGRPAYSDPEGGTPMLSLMRRIHEDPLPELPASVPVELGQAVRRAMSKDPADRQNSAAELAAEIEAADLTRVADPSRSRSVVLATAALAVLLVAVVGALVAVLTLRDGSDEVVDGPPDTATPTSVATPTPTPPATATPEPSTVEFDVTAARAAAARALVRVEAFSCTGAQIATGVVLNDGLVVTSERVLQSPWYIDVTVDGETRNAEPQTSDRNRELALILVEDPSIFDELPGVAAADGDRVAIVGIDGALVQATLAVAPTGPPRLFAELDDPTEVTRLGDANIVVSDAEALVGITAIDGATVEVHTPSSLEIGWNRIPPSFGCPTLVRDLSPDDVESSVSPAIGELLTMQQLSNAYANESWHVVRRLEPAKVTFDDARFIEGWRPLRQGFVYPVDRQVDDDGMSRWRIGLIGHETWSGNDLTTLFCVTWSVDPVLGQVTQTNEDNVTVYGSQPGQPQRNGFVDPKDLRPLIVQNCPLTDS